MPKTGITITKTTIYIFTCVHVFPLFISSLYINSKIFVVLNFSSWYTPTFKSLLIVAFSFLSSHLEFATTRSRMTTMMCMCVVMIAVVVWAVVIIRPPSTNNFRLLIHWVIRIEFSYVVVVFLEMVSLGFMWTHVLKFLW